MTRNSERRPADPFTERTPRVVAASKLHRATARRKARRFLAEGRNCVESALAVAAAREIFMTEHALQRHSDLVDIAHTRSVPVSVVTDRAMTRLSDTVTPPGLVALCGSLVNRESASAVAAAANSFGNASLQSSSTPRLVAIGQALAEPGNVGTLIRVADALGADEVWLTEDSADPEGPKAVRASAGSVFYMTVRTGISVPDVPSLAAQHGLQLLAATGDGDIDITSVAGKKLLEAPTAWVFGNEAHGVHTILRDAANGCVRIPLRGRAESLNIATAAAICLHSSATALSATPNGPGTSAGGRYA